MNIVKCMIDIKPPITDDEIPDVIIRQEEIWD